MVKAFAKGGSWCRQPNLLPNADFWIKLLKSIRPAFAQKLNRKIKIQLLPSALLLQIPF